MDNRRHSLILCTRNSARSQTAEGILQKHVGDRFHVYSAGLNPGRIHPLVEPVMREIGIDISAQRSKSVQEYLGKITAHYLIVVCANAERNCPKVFPGLGERVYWPLDDPADVEGTEQEQLQAFRRVRDQIHARLLEWLAGLNAD